MTTDHRTGERAPSDDGARDVAEAPATELGDPQSGVPSASPPSTPAEPAPVEPHSVQPDSGAATPSPESATASDPHHIDNDSAPQPTTEPGRWQPQPHPASSTAPSAHASRASVAAVVVGAIIIGLGLTGLVTGVSPLGWAASFAIGLVTASAIATIGILAAWRINDDPTSG